MAVRIVSLTARLGLDGTSFQQGLTRAGRNFSQWAGSIKGQLTGLFAAASVVSYARGIQNTVSRFKDLSEQYRVTTDEVQTLDAAAKKSNQTFEDIGTALIKLTNQRREAAEGNKELRASFAEFGVTMEDLNNPALRSLDILQKIAAAVQGMRLNPRQADDLNNLLGSRNGEKLAAVFKDLAGIKLNLIPEETINIIDQASKKLEMLKLQLQEIGARLVTLTPEDFEPSIINKLRERFGFGRSDTDSTKGFTKEEVASANAAKHGRLQQMFAMEKLFTDEAKEKETARLKKEAAEEERRIAEKILEIQMQMLGPAERRAALEAQIEEHLKRGDRLKALETLQAFTAVPAQTTQGFSTNVGSMGQRGGFTGLGLERAFALLGGSNEAKQTAENTRKSKEVLQEINAKIRAGEAEDEFEF